MTRSRLTVIALCSLVLAAPAAAQSLRGSSWSITRQNRVAREHQFSYLASSRGVRDFVSKGYLVRVPGNGDYTLARVSYPYARPEAKLFIERLAAQYRGACGERLVVTSLTRPLNRQPSNASRRSVHPTGMAVDLRRTNNMTCRRWLERSLLDLEKQGVIEATRETRPPHYHIAVFPNPYARYVASLGGQLPAQSAGEDLVLVRYRVRRGDSLWTIARDYGIDVETLKDLNDLRGSRIYAGQTLKVPGR